MIEQLLYALVAVAFASVYAWSFYNIPILVAGVRSLRKSSKRKTAEKEYKSKELPFVSIIVPAKNESKVIGRLLDALANLDYPAEKREIIVVEDGSADGTLDSCMRHASNMDANVKILHKSVSEGKPSALNCGIGQARGEIIGVFDADSVPSRDVLLKAVGYFDNSEISAVQGRTLSINSEENMLTKFVSLEETLWSEGYLRGKDALGLFVHLKGTCQFFRRDVLKELKGFDENSLSEDMELSVRLTERGHKIRYASDVRTWQESTASLRQMLWQRVRWYRGHLEIALKYGKLMANPSKKNLDAEITLFCPLVLITSLVALLAGGWMTFLPFPFGVVLEWLMKSATVVGLMSMILCGLALIFSLRPMRLRAALWVPFTYFYWVFQSFMALYALLLIVFRRPRRWVKTEKTGVINVAGSERGSLPR